MLASTEGYQNAPNKAEYLKTQLEKDFVIPQMFQVGPDGMLSITASVVQKYIVRQSIRIAA